MVFDRDVPMTAIKFSKAQMRSFGSSAQQAQRLRERGFLVFEVDGAIARFTGRGARFPTADVRNRLGPLLLMGGMWLAGVKRRLLRGKLSTVPKRWQATPKGKRQGYAVSMLYAGRSKAGRSDVFSDSSAAFHSKAAAQPGVVTGALVKSLQARGSGRSAVRFDAQGSSVGSSTYIRRIEPGKRGNKGGKAAKLKAGRFVRNQWKLNAVWRHLRANMIQPQDDEVQAIASAIADGAHKEFWQAMTGAEQASAVPVKQATRQLGVGADARLYRDLVRKWVKS